MTFQNRLSLLMQAHPELTTSPAVPKAWVQNWVEEIKRAPAGGTSKPAATAVNAT
jgi:hypothetical protein